MGWQKNPSCGHKKQIMWIGSQGASGYNKLCTDAKARQPMLMEVGTWKTGWHVGHFCHHTFPILRIMYGIHSHKTWWSFAGIIFKKVKAASQWMSFYDYSPWYSNSSFVFRGAMSPFQMLEASMERAFMQASAFMLCWWTAFLEAFHWQLLEAGFWKQDARQEGPFIWSSRALISLMLEKVNYKALFSLGSERVMGNTGHVLNFLSIVSMIFVSSLLCNCSTVSPPYLRALHSA